MRQNLRKTFMLIALSILLLPAFSQQDKRITYLWDVTLSMKGYNGAPDIYQKVVDVMIKDIKSNADERTEIVVIPFQDGAYCEVWKERATAEGKARLAEQIKNYNNEKVTNTNISAPIKYVSEKIFTADRLDIMKLMTDGNDNVNFDNLRRVLAQWCEVSKQKNAYGYYIILTAAAKNEELSKMLSEACNFEEIDASGMLENIADIRQLNNGWKGDLLINIRDEYNKPKRLKFAVTAGNEKIPAGFKIHFKTKENPYLVIDETAEMQADNTVSITPKFLMSQSELKENLPEDYNFNEIELEYETTEDMRKGRFAFTRLLDKSCRISLENKSVNTVKIYVKQ